jgi:hypothetical protein
LLLSRKPAASARDCAAAADILTCPTAKIISATNLKALDIVAMAREQAQMSHVMSAKLFRNAERQFSILHRDIETRLDTILGRG